MFIYLKSDEAFLKQLTKRQDSRFHELCGLSVFDLESAPHIEVPEDFDLLKDNKVFKKFFLKATVKRFPKYESLNLNQTLCRSYGTYHLRNANGELTPPEGAQSGRYQLKIETSEWEGIKDIQTLQRKLWAGTITPSDLYDQEQKEPRISKFFRMLRNGFSAQKSLQS